LGALASGLIGRFIFTTTQAFGGFPAKFLSDFSLLTNAEQGERKQIFEGID